MGKVHGSLARAGKVKQQCPKVEKQEKKKQPKGRAKKRMQYNRRFVNVVLTPGGKRKILSATQAARKITSQYLSGDWDVINANVVRGTAISGATPLGQDREEVGEALGASITENE
ncbi:ribosomal protein S30-domain-containing protein [Dioszegia hungarica]|uniref:Ribosomal protein S30-domain-containing protein n=1 Tax=Dioszegia hungarica TaxID=4972 RepID=A0AA38LUC4_9TREE|nr:ribosomal protein S30-domain-containing protein [Dioszegia hungarica]KAI9633691.1 ribosomal protein S30-domain-containing protein [Dioszegia hungarica]